MPRIGSKQQGENRVSSLLVLCRLLLKWDLNDREPFLRIYLIPNVIYIICARVASYSVAMFAKIALFVQANKKVGNPFVLGYPLIFDLFQVLRP